MIDLKEYLLIDYEFVTEFMGLLKNSLYGVILLFFVIAIIFEMVNNGDILGVIKRLILCIVVISTFSTIHHYAVNTSFKIANHIANELSDNTALLKGVVESIDEALDQKRKEMKSKGAWKWIKYNLLLGPEINTLITLFFVLVSKLLLLLSKAIYTVTHNINYGLIAIPSVLCILPQFRGSLSGALKTTAWCVTMPFVVLFLLMILSWELTHDVGNPLDHMAVMFCFLIMLVLSGAISWGLLSGTGVMGAAAIGGTILGAKMASMSTRAVGLLWKKNMLGAGVQLLSGLGNVSRGGLSKARSFISPHVKKHNNLLESGGSHKNFSPDDQKLNTGSQNIKKQKETTLREKGPSSKVDNMSKNQSSVKNEQSVTQKSDIKTQKVGGVNKQSNIEVSKKDQVIKNKKNTSSQKTSINKTVSRNNGITAQSGRRFPKARKTANESRIFVKKRIESERFRRKLNKRKFRPKLDQ